MWLAVERHGATEDVASITALLDEEEEEEDQG